jgi:hypothetical protein
VQRIEPGSLGIGQSQNLLQCRERIASKQYLGLVPLKEFPVHNMKSNRVRYATTKDATTNDPKKKECYNEEFLSINSECYNEHRCYNERMLRRTNATTNILNLDTA